MSDTSVRSIAEICASIDGGKPVTKAEAETVVRAIERRCRGPRSTSLPRVRLLERMGFTVQRGPDGGLAAIIPPANLVLEEPAARVLFGYPHDASTLPDAAIDELLHGLFALGERTLASAVDAAARGNSCGYDLNDTILAQALDGEDHPATCPRCGTDLSYTAPRISLTEEEG